MLHPGLFSGISFPLLGEFVCYYPRLTTIGQLCWLPIRLQLHSSLQLTFNSVILFPISRYPPLGTSFSSLSRLKSSMKFIDLDSPYLRALPDLIKIEPDVSRSRCWICVRSKYSCIVGERVLNVLNTGDKYDYLLLYFSPIDLDLGPIKPFGNRCPAHLIGTFHSLNGLCGLNLQELGIMPVLYKSVWDSFTFVESQMKYFTKRHSISRRARKQSHLLTLIHKYHTICYILLIVAVNKFEWINSWNCTIMLFFIT